VVDSAGIEPASPACDTGVFPLDDEPERCVSRTLPPETSAPLASSGHQSCVFTGPSTKPFRFHAWWTHRDLHPKPLDCQPSALLLSYAPLNISHVAVPTRIELAYDGRQPPILTRGLRNQIWTFHPVVRASVSYSELLTSSLCSGSARRVFHRRSNTHTQASGVVVSPGPANRSSRGTRAMHLGCLSERPR
jgi:hypothetical protein